MVLVPMLFGDMWDGCMDSPLRSTQIIGKHLNRDPFPGSFLVTLDNRPRVYRRKQCCHIPKQCNDDEKEQKVANKSNTTFQINLDVQEFKPEEISVKATSQFVIVEAKHEEKDDENGYVLKHFVRRFQLPDGHDSLKIASTLSSDGVLTISAPKLALPEPERERSIPVKQAEVPKADEKQDESVADNKFTLEDLDE